MRPGSVPSVGVIGAGVFGTSIAAELARSGFAVVLHDRRLDIVSGATARNLARVHRGYHYPRDPATAADSLHGSYSFMASFAAALAPPVPNYYAIAATGSRTNAQQFLEHCGRLGLRARPVRHPDLVPGSVEACFEVDEAYYDPELLRAGVWEQLRALRVRVELGTTLGPREIARSHDFVVVATYASVNETLRGLGCTPIELQYELCEIPVVHVPAMRGCSMVVLDGSFVSIAPHGDQHVLYDVVESVHARAVGYADPWPRGLSHELDGPPVVRSTPTRFGSVLASSQRFLAPLDDTVHVGSLFAKRVVLPRQDHTDARPTLVRWASPTVISVLSGKVSTSIEAARSVVRSIAARVGMRLAGA